MKKAIILFSGGLDSTTILMSAINEGYDCYPISFSYGQKHSIELEAAKQIATFLNVKDHKIISLPNDMFGNSALTNQNFETPSFSPDSKQKIPVTYVPARNTIFLSIALGYAESIGSCDIFIGVSRIDYTHYPDCRPEYITAFEKLSNLATKSGIEGEKISIHAPLLYLSKAETIKLGEKNGVDFAMTVSCYNADKTTGAACGECDSCTYRKKGFEEAGISDPTLYKNI